MTDEAATLAEVRRLRAEDPTIGNVKIGRALGISRQQAERLLNKLKLADAQAKASLPAVAAASEVSGLSYYDTARQALAKAKSVDEVKDVRDHSERMRLYARQQGDKSMLADATDIRLRAGRELGAMLADARSKGQLDRGRPPKENGRSDQPLRIKLEEIGVTKDLSSEAQRLSSISERAFEAMVDRTREKIIAGKATVINPLKDLSTGEKKDRRDNRERVLGAMIQEGNLRLPTKRYGVILADPEWKFETWSPAGLDRSADNHYATSETAKIAARPVADIAAKDCVLFLWATAPMLPHALHVMAAWGFEYKSHAIWDKGVAGTGYWFRNAHELILVGTRGNVVAPAMGTQPSSVFTTPRDAHSVKPDCVYEIIEQWFPHLPKIELNAREVREGWDAWGAEAPTVDPNTGEISEAAE